MSSKSHVMPQTWIDHLFHRSPVAMSITTPDGRYLEVNARYLELFGLTRQEVGDRSTVELLEVDLKQREEVLDAVRESGRVTGVEALVRRPDGAERLVLSSFERIDYEGRPAILAMSQDISDRKRMEEALRESEARYRAVIGQAPVVLYALDEEGRFILSEGRGLEGAGLGSGELVGRALTEVFGEGEMKLPGGEALPYAEVHRRVLDGEALVGFTEFRGAVFENHLVPMRDPDGRIRGVTGVALDVTERRRAEEDLDLLLTRMRRARRRLAVLSRRLVEVQEQERRALSRELHDEMGQLLTGLQLQLERRGDGRDGLEGRRDVMLGLVEDLMARVRTLTTELRPPALDDLGLVPALLGYLDRYTERTGVEVRFTHAHAARRFSPEVELAAFRLVQEALTNVARHAGVKEVKVELSWEEDRLRVEVRDSGQGFRSRRVQGRGGGLSGMRERLRILGGSIDLRAAPGRGTVLVATIPTPSGRESG